MNTMKYISPITIALSLLLTGCSNRPMSMAGFMINSNAYYTDAQITMGTLIDTTIEENDSFDYISYKELPFNISAATSFKIGINGLKVGGSFGINGLSFNTGYVNDYVGLMAWINAQIGIPCYGGQIAIPIINNKTSGFGPIMYYSKNEVIKTKGEKLSFELMDISRGYSYNEVGAGLYFIYQLNEKRAILLDFKLGKNIEINTYRAYIDISYAINY